MLIPEFLLTLLIRRISGGFDEQVGWDGSPCLTPLSTAKGWVESFAAMMDQNQRRIECENENLCLQYQRLFGNPYKSLIFSPQDKVTPFWEFHDVFNCSKCIKNGSFFSIMICTIQFNSISIQFNFNSN